ncbi:MAG: hypothetical protein P1U40_01865 [Coxiellaceae bacterium]|nr:hypothetical protein [Coxiellaceae bacterium]
MKTLKRHFLHIFISGAHWHFSLWARESQLWRCRWQQRYANGAVDWPEIRRTVPRWLLSLFITMDNRLTQQQPLTLTQDMPPRAIESYVHQQLNQCFGQQHEQLVFDYLTLYALPEQKLWLVAMPRQQQQQLLLKCRALKHRPCCINVDYLVIASALPQFISDAKAMLTVFVSQQHVWLTLYRNHDIAEIRLHSDEICSSRIVHHLQQWQAHYQLKGMPCYMISLNHYDDTLCQQLSATLPSLLWWQPTRLHKRPWTIEDFIGYCTAIGEAI